MYKLSCQDVDIEDCDHESKGENSQKVVDDMMKHVKKEHPETLSALSENMNDDQVSDMFKSRVQQM